MKKVGPDERARLSAEAYGSHPPHPICGVLDNIRSIYNVGSMFRTADAVRAEHLYLTGYTGTPEHSNMHKTALGAQDAVPWSEHDSPLGPVRTLRERGYTIAALELTDDPTDLEDVTAEAFPLCLIVGNEVEGVRKELLREADLALELPQYGSKHSFNVSVAFGIACFHLVRRYRAARGLDPEDPLPSPADGSVDR